MKREEQQHQISLIEWASWVKLGSRRLSNYLHHSPNGGGRSKAEAGILKAMGVMAGFPDLALTIAVPPFHGLYIEMKSVNGVLSDDQVKTHLMLCEEGYRVDVCFTIDEAKRSIERYLEPSGRLFAGHKAQLDGAAAT